jgi:DHA2 family multidrug resistance protein-like MFS transporter
VSAVPAAQSGVASAMNTVARMVSGALGVAVIGSLVNSLYEDDVEPALSALPAPAREAAGESIGAAGAVAGQLPPEAGSSLLANASDSFVGAMGVGLGVGAAMTFATALIVLRVLPGRPARERPAKSSQRQLADIG